MDAVDVEAEGGGADERPKPSEVTFGSRDHVNDPTTSTRNNRQGVPVTLTPGMKGVVWDKQMHIGSNTFAFIAADARILDGVGGQVKRGRSVHLEVDLLGWDVGDKELEEYRRRHDGREYETPVHHMLIWTLKDQTLDDMDDLAERWKASEGGEQRSTDTIKHWAVSYTHLTLPTILLV